jgi:hypothetical protein
MQQKRPSRLALIPVALVCALLASHVTRAQDVTESALKAAFIYNLAKFTEWPEETPAPRVFPMCVIGDSATAEALDRTVKGRQLSGQSISVTRLTAAGATRSCRLIYLSGIRKEQSAQILAGLKGAPVLTISDLDGFTESGGIVEFFFEHGQLRFRIGVESAKRSGLQLSAKILTLAVRK